MNGYNDYSVASWGRHSTAAFLAEVTSKIEAETDPVLLAQLALRKSFIEKRYAAYDRDYINARQVVNGFNSADITRAKMLGAVGACLSSISLKIQEIRAEQNRVWGLCGPYSVDIRAILISTYGLLTAEEYTVAMAPVYDLEWAFYCLVDALKSFQIDNTGGFGFATYYGVVYSHLLALVDALCLLASSPEMEAVALDMAGTVTETSLIQFNICERQKVGGWYATPFGIIDDIKYGRYTLLQCQSAVAQYLSIVDYRICQAPLDAQSLAYWYGVVIGQYDSIFDMNI